MEATCLDLSHAVTVDGIPYYTPPQRISVPIGDLIAARSDLRALSLDEIYMRTIIKQAYGHPQQIGYPLDIMGVRSLHGKCTVFFHSWYYAFRLEYFHSDFLTGYLVNLYNQPKWLEEYQVWQQPVLPVPPVTPPQPRLKAEFQPYIPPTVRELAEGSRDSRNPRPDPPAHTRD